MAEQVETVVLEHLFFAVRRPVSTRIGVVESVQTAVMASAGAGQRSDASDGDGGAAEDSETK